jgi:hypothetical protein
MALPITKLSDYEAGRFALPQNQISNKQLIQFIVEVEPEILNKLLGCELAKLFIDDLSNEPKEDRFIKIYDPFCEDVNNCGRILDSNGIVNMLKGFIYFYYGRTLSSRLTSVGAKKVDSENSTNTKESSTALIRNYNYGVETYKAIQEYICLNAEIYPEYNGINKKLIGYL